MRSSARPTDQPQSVPASSPKRERFAARLTDVQKELFQRAADLSGRSLTDFVLTAAQTVAEDTIRTYQVLELTARETEAFLVAVENPPRLHPKLEAVIRNADKLTEMVW